MANLNLSTVELVSTLRAAPQNGSPSSQDYNDSWAEALADLASLAGFIDDILIPMLNGLDATIMPNPQGTPNGLEGRYIFSDTSDLTAVFFDQLSSEPLTIAESLRVLNGIVQTVDTTVQSLTVSVTALQTQLSSTNQNDIAQALQNFAAQLQSLQALVNSLAQSVSSATITLETNSTVNALQSKLNLIAGPNVTLTSDSNGGVTIQATSAITGLILKTNHILNSDQTHLDLVAGTGITLGYSSGQVTITNSTADADFYQTVQQAGSPKNQRSNLNFLSPVTATDNSGNNSTDIAVSVFVGDSGFGGVIGLVPAPASGDAAANKFLKADGTWTAIVDTDFYQTVQRNALSVTQRGNLNFSTDFTVTDNSGNNSTDVGITFPTDTDFYQTVQQAGSSKPQESRLNFLSPITATDNSGNTSTDVAVSVFIGDSGSGGVIGLVPAPAAGDAAANKFLNADGNWTVVTDTDYYQTVQSRGSAQTQRPTLNFLNPLSAADNSGNTSTDVSVALGGVTVYTSSQNAAAGDSGKLIQFNSSSAVTYTLLATPASSVWWVLVKNIGTGILTVARNTTTIDGQSRDMKLWQGDSVLIFTDGTNYQTGSPRVAGIGAFNAGVGTNSQILLLMVPDRQTIFPANAPNSTASAGTASSGTATFTLKKNGTSFCTVSFTSSATGTFTQASDAIFNGTTDVLEIDGPATADTTLSDFSIVLQGYRF